MTQSNKEACEACGRDWDLKKKAVATGIEIALKIVSEMRNKCSLPTESGQLLFKILGNVEDEIAKAFPILDEILLNEPK